MNVKPSSLDSLNWKAIQPDGTWFEASFALPDISIIQTSDFRAAEYLQKLLQKAMILNPNFLSENSGFDVETSLNYDRLWGLGSSSTLIANIGNWAKVDPYTLLRTVSSGSGYDIACANAEGPILYQLQNTSPRVTNCKFSPPFRDSLYFVYLGKKQDSAREISSYRHKAGSAKEHDLIEINAITEAILNCSQPAEFCRLILKHEEIIGNIIQHPSINKDIFRDFPGTAKSLGAWGGDFALLYTELDPEELKSKLFKLGLTTYFKFTDIIIQNSEA